MKTEPGFNRREVLGWAFYDFGNSAFSSLVLTFVFATYFTSVIAPDKITGTALWSRGLSTSGLVVAFLSPFLGALADRGGFRKLFLAVLTGVAVIATANLYTVLPGQTLKAITFFVIANLCLELGMVFYNSFLPDIAPLKKIGRISGYGWAFGYLGGLIALIIALFGFVQPETPIFNLSKDADQHIRATTLLTAAWFGLFSLPFFVWVRERRPVQKLEYNELLGSTINQLSTTFKEIKNYRQIVRLLIARIFYNDAILTIFAFGGIYAAGTFSFSNEEILIFGIVLSVAAGTGAFLLGFLDDIIGGKKMILITNIAFVVATLIAVFAPNKFYFWIAGIMVGLFSGPNQASSRALMGRFVPSEKETEFFGFFAFSGKATAFIGPLAFGFFTEVFNTQRAGIAVTTVLFIIGSVLLYFVDEAEGLKLSQANSNESSD